MLKILNSLSGRKEEFKPIVPNNISIYLCGITAYDMCHVGHLRVAINFDVIINYLKHCGYKTKYVRNITDIDDKIIQRALEEDRNFLDISRHYSNEMHKDYLAFDLLKPDFEPRATSYIKEMISLIKNLEQNGNAYLTSKGDLCYRVRKFKQYGKLSHKKVDELRSGIRVEEDKTKEDPLDFVLWKSSNPGEPYWNSPWGKGRPGWHIECSAMVRCCLANTIDIHGGGRDLIFPHHENEIAQSEAAHNSHLANYWMHCGHLMINGKKMSKSLNNFITIRDLRQEYNPEVVKYFINSAHYRTQLDFSPLSMQQAYLSLEHLYRALEPFSDAQISKAQYLSEEEQAFFAAMDDDFNTPKALAILFNLAKIVHKNKEVRAAKSLLKCGNLLGILKQSATEFLQQGIKAKNITLAKLNIQKIELLVIQRDKARKEKDWAKADELREQLSKMGVKVEDTPNGGIWRAQ